MNPGSWLVQLPTGQWSPLRRGQNCALEILMKTTEHAEGGYFRNTWMSECLTLDPIKITTGANGYYNFRVIRHTVGRSSILQI